MGRVAFRLCLVLLAATAAADELRLKTGSSFEGKIVAKAAAAPPRRDDTIGPETPPKQEAPSPAAPPDGLFLRDGRCIPGTRETAPAIGRQSQRPSGCCCAASHFSPRSIAGAADSMPKRFIVSRFSSP